MSIFFYPFDICVVLYKLQWSFCSPVGRMDGRMVCVGQNVVGLVNFKIVRGFEITSLPLECFTSGGAKFVDTFVC